MTIERWLPSESGTTTEQSLDILAEKIYQLELAVQERRQPVFLDTQNISETGTFSTTITVDVEATSFVGSVLFIGFIVNGGTSSFRAKIAGGVVPAGIPDGELTSGDMASMVFPIKSPGVTNLTLTISGTVSAGTFDVDIEPVMISL